jgi:hypothetical protein
VRGESLSEVTAHFPGEGPSASAARRFVASTLDSWGMGSLVEMACLLVAELVANVILHAGTDLDVRLLITDGGARVEVHDASVRLPERKFHSSTSTTGRGLMLVAEVSQRWGAAHTPTGKMVWFEMDCDVDPQSDGGLPVRLEDWEDWHDFPAPPVRPPSVPSDGPARAGAPGAPTPGHLR